MADRGKENRKMKELDIEGSLHGDMKIMCIGKMGRWEDIVHRKDGTIMCIRKMGRYCS